MGRDRVVDTGDDTDKRPFSMKPYRATEISFKWARVGIIIKFKVIQANEENLNLIRSHDGVIIQKFDCYRIGDGGYIVMRRKVFERAETEGSAKADELDMIVG